MEFSSSVEDRAYDMFGGSSSSRGIADNVHRLVAVINKKSLSKDRGWRVMMDYVDNVLFLRTPSSKPVILPGVVRVSKIPDPVDTITGNFFFRRNGNNKRSTISKGIENGKVDVGTIIAWLDKRDLGFKIRNVNHAAITLRPLDSTRIQSVHVNCSISIDDQVKFQQSLDNGIGSQKIMGLGLLHI